MIRRLKPLIVQVTTPVNVSVMCKTNYFGILQNKFPLRICLALNLLSLHERMWRLIALSSSK